MFHTSKSCEQLKIIQKYRFEHLENSNVWKNQMFSDLLDVWSVSYLNQWKKDAEVTTKEKSFH